MNSITITNATNGAIINITQFHRSGLDHIGIITLTCLAVACIGTGLYLLLRKPKSKTP
jgi:hypothetical protein